MSQNSNRSPISKLSITSPALRPDCITVRCHGCGTEMAVRSDPAHLWVGRTYITCHPCPEAPHICSGCRQDRKRLDKAREAMDRHFLTCEIRKGESGKGEVAA